LREEREYREYSSDEQRSRVGCIVGRMPRDFAMGCSAKLLFHVQSVTTSKKVGFLHH